MDGEAFSDVDLIDHTSDVKALVIFHECLEKPAGYDSGQSVDIQERSSPGGRAAGHGS
jgi:hypothetical protein